MEVCGWTVALVGAAVLLLALAAEIARRRCRGRRIVAFLDRHLPSRSRRTAASLLTVLSVLGTLVVPTAVAHADDHTRSWLEDGSGPTPATTSPAGDEASSATSASGPAGTRAWLGDAPDSSTSRTTGVTTTTAPPPVSTTTTRPVSPPAVIGDVGPRVGPVRLGPVLRTAAPPANPTPQVAPAAPIARSFRSVPPPPRVAPSVPAATYTVAPGDCLWSIAARLLGAGATAGVIDRGWRAIYAANVGAVGADPNLIHPGLVLALPPLDPTP
jgi:nucleoid-associated protein YgaU